MQLRLPDLIVIDLEMPRLEGFVLARQMPADARTAHVPIVVVTSRLAEKHRRYAA
jgi:chemosensory pili system protein ChpA (sensor histidine kinase/response regulator)